jgi:hypothetical protein
MLNDSHLSGFPVPSETVADLVAERQCLKDVAWPQYMFLPHKPSAAEVFSELKHCLEKRYLEIAEILTFVSAPEQLLLSGVAKQFRASDLDRKLFYYVFKLEGLALRCTHQQANNNNNNRDNTASFE